MKDSCLSGVDATGLLGLWRGEEAMAHYILHQGHQDPALCRYEHPRVTMLFLSLTHPPSHSLSLSPSSLVAIEEDICLHPPDSATSLCELGAGMGLAGLCGAATLPLCRRVLLTDGNASVAKGSPSFLA